MIDMLYLGSRFEGGIRVVQQRRRLCVGTLRCFDSAKYECVAPC